MAKFYLASVGLDHLVQLTPGALGANLRRIGARFEDSVELYVGNLPWSVTDEVLTNMFAAHGAVGRAKVVMDRETGRSRGFGFVTMTNAPEGQAAIQALNGLDYEGRALRVREAEPRQPGERPPRREGGGGGYGGGAGGGGYGGKSGGGYGGGKSGGDRY